MLSQQSLPPRELRIARAANIAVPAEFTASGTLRIALAANIAVPAEFTASGTLRIARSVPETGDLLGQYDSTELAVNNTKSLGNTGGLSFFNKLAKIIYLQYEISDRRSR